MLAEEKTLQTFFEEAVTNAARLRARRRADARTVVATLPGPRSVLTGEAFVDTVGAVVRVARGSSDFFYTPEAIPMRDVALGRLEESRRAFFAALAAQFPPRSRILNVGAGGDVVPIDSMRDAGHEIISTDFAMDTVEALKRRIDTPAFACDLADLAEILPAEVDFMIGNSTLAYLDPPKARRIVSNLFRAMRYGAVFTFDLSPHPHYFCIAEGKTKPTLINESAADPATLAELINRYGAKDGMGAMAHRTVQRGESVNAAVVSVLKGFFEAEGARCRMGRQFYRDRSGGQAHCLVLRVAKAHDAILTPVAGEEFFDPSLSPEEQATGKPPLLVLACLDRDSGEVLARLLGIHQDRRQDPWLVADYVETHQDPRSLPDEVRRAVLAELNPARLAERIRTCLERGQYEVPTPLPFWVATDQFFHKSVIMGEVPFSREAADLKIDDVEKQRAESLRNTAARQRDDAAKEKKRKERKRQKESRKKGR